MGRRAAAEGLMQRGCKGGGVSAVALVGAGLMLSGYMGAVDCEGSRYRSVSSQTQSVTVTGYADSYNEVLCAYQQTKDGVTLSAPLACTYPSTSSNVDGCGVPWYSWSLTFSLLGSNGYWFSSTDKLFSRVVISRNATGGSFYTATGDWAESPSDDGTCWRSRIGEGARVVPITYFLNGVPDVFECTGGENGSGGCPFTCNLPRGCDESYGTSQNEFYDSAYRTNASGQNTALLRFDAYGQNAASGTPGGDWTYQAETPQCLDGPYYGSSCTTSANCGGYTCAAYWTVMRRNDYTPDSLNVRRGESRRNFQVEAYAKTKQIDLDHYEMGLVGRFYNRDNYHVFMLREYGGDTAVLHRYVNGSYEIQAAAYPSFNLTIWNRIGFKMVDLGSYTNTTWVPNGYCSMAGKMNGSVLVSASSAPCGNAPYGKYGVFTYFMRDAQFWDLDAFAL